MTGPPNKIKPSGKSLLTLCKEHTPPINHISRAHLSWVLLNYCMHRRKTKHYQRRNPKHSPLPWRATDSGQHMRHIMLQDCSQAHNIKNNKQFDGCLEHFAFYIGLKGNHNSNTAYHQLQETISLQETVASPKHSGSEATPVCHGTTASFQGTIWNHLTLPEVQLCSLPKQNRFCWGWKFTMKMSDLPRKPLKNISGR